MKVTYKITSKNFENDIALIEEKLSKTKAGKRELSRTRLILEESFHRFKKGLGRGEDFEVSAAIRQRFDSVSVQLIVQGSEFNPLVKMEPDREDTDELDEDDYRCAILNAYVRQVGYTRKNDYNILTVSVHEAGSHTIRDTFVCMVAGIIVAVALKNLMPADRLASFQEGFIVPLRTIFLTLLQMMVAPVVFFSILSGMISMSDKNNLGKRGAKLIGISLSMIFCITILALLASFALFRGDMPAIRQLLQHELQEQSLADFSFMDMLVDIIPVDIVDPFTGSNMLQTLFIAIFFGVIRNHWPHGARVMVTVQLCNLFFMRVLSVIVMLVPGFVFISMINMTISTGADSFVALGQLVLGNAAGLVIVWIFAGIAVMLVVKISPVKYLKKLISYSIIPFSLSSSNAAIPFTLEFCTEKLGIDNKISTFSIPIGIQFNKAGACFFLSMASVMTIRAYQMPITPDLIAKLFFAVFVMSMAKPSVPAAGIVCLSSVFAAIGIAPEAVEIVLCITPILNMFNTATGASCNVTSTTLLAGTEGCINKSVYK